MQIEQFAWQRLGSHIEFHLELEPRGTFGEPSYPYICVRAQEETRFERVRILVEALGPSMRFQDHIELHALDARPVIQALPGIPPHSASGVGGTVEDALVTRVLVRLLQLVDGSGLDVAEQSAPERVYSL